VNRALYQEIKKKQIKKNIFFDNNLGYNAFQKLAAFGLNFF